MTTVKSTLSSRGTLGLCHMVITLKYKSHSCIIKDSAKPFHIVGGWSSDSTFFGGQSNPFHHFRRLVTPFLLEVNDSQNDSWPVKGGQRYSSRVKEVKFLLFYLLLINLYLSYFLERIHIYRRRKRLAHFLRKVVRLSPIRERSTHSLKKWLWVPPK